MALTVTDKKLARLASTIADYMDCRKIQCMWLEENPEKMFPKEELKNKFAQLMRDNHEAVVAFWKDSVFIAFPKMYYTHSKKVSEIEQWFEEQTF